MRALVSALAAVCLLAQVGLGLPIVDQVQAQLRDPGSGGPGPGGGTPSPTFSFSICNLSTSPKIYVAVISRAQAGFRAQGWWTVPQGDQCTKIGDFRRPEIWVYTNDGQGSSWGKPTLQVCADLNKSFDYTWDGKARVCQRDEELAGFVRLAVEPNAPGLDWRLRD
jgi:uncharacterized membrane protein